MTTFKDIIALHLYRFKQGAYTEEQALDEIFKFFIDHKHLFEYDLIMSVFHLKEMTLARSASIRSDQQAAARDSGGSTGS